MIEIYNIFAKTKKPHGLYFQNQYSIIRKQLYDAIKPTDETTHLIVVNQILIHNN
jgi:hypothetical protein